VELGLEPYTVAAHKAAHNDAATATRPVELGCMGKV
jgi:hypothetical protein